ncbi:MAG TPA: DUF4367 domain-containing protein [Candidatus Binatia bacterium]|jgi:hypothetical protein|nr:DUF4367 domain-containing protein [Candidatus Binatia bacterium]
MRQNEEFQDVMEQLAALAPQKSDAPQAPQLALAQLKRRFDGDQTSPFITLRRFFVMSRRKYVLSGLLVLLLLVVAFSLPPVRAAASDFLGLFRVQKFAAISVSPRQMAMLEQIADQGLYPGEFQSVQEPGPPQEVASLEEAAALNGGPVASARALGAPARISVSGPGSGRLIVDMVSARRILRAAELDPQLLPDSLDGAEVDVSIFPAVEQRWDDGLTFLQSPSPLIDYPDDVDPNVLGEALLQMLGMSQVEAQRLAASIDWSSTLLLPVPENVATFSEVTVNGASALALNSVDGGDSSLMWQKDGVIFVLVGTRSTEELLKIAESVQ